MTNVVSRQQCLSVQIRKKSPSFVDPFLPSHFTPARGAEAHSRAEVANLRPRITQPLPVISRGRLIIFLRGRKCHSGKNERLFSRWAPSSSSSSSSPSPCFAPLSLSRAPPRLQTSNYWECVSVGRSVCRGPCRGRHLPMQTQFYFVAKCDLLL